VNGTIESKPYAPLRLSVLEERLAVCRLDPLTELPAWATTAALFYSVTRTPGELSIVCPEEIVPDGVTREGGWRALKLDGTFDFGQVGVLVSVTAPLAQAGVSIFAVSTFDTDYVLVKEPQLAAAVAALRDHGHEVQGDKPAGDRAVAIRPATGEDEEFLWEMLAKAAQENSVRAVAENPGTAKYVEGWGRDGDLGVVAVAVGGEPLGAAWLRLLRGENAGYGYVDDKTPELAIAVRPWARGTGIGARLISHLLQAAKSRYRMVSLSVRSDNPALNLYERMGFRPVEGSHRTNRTGGTSITMKLDLHG
jgi:ribosomal protein S18 acetylase RimI-like enzyme